MVLAYSYQRFSSAQQRGKGSEVRQLKRAEEWCKRNKIPLSKESFRDLGVSGFTGENADVGKLGAFIQAVESGAIAKGSYLICESLDRLSRQPFFGAVALLERIIKSGIILVTLVPERILTEKDCNEMRLMEVVFDLMRAHGESLRKSDLAIQSWIKRRKNKLKLCNGASWLFWKNDKWIVDQEKAKVVKMIFQLAGNNQGITQILRCLNDKNIKPIARGKSWNSSFISITLRNRAVIGEHQPCTIKHGKQVPEGEAMPDMFPSIIDENLFYKVQEILRIRGLGKFRGRGQRTTHNLFSGLLKDARDNASLIYQRGNNHGKAQPFVVNIKAFKNEVDTPAIPFPYEPLEDAILVNLESLSTSDFLGKNQDDLNRLRVAEHELKSVKKKIETLQKQMTEQDDIDALIPTLKKFELQRKTLTNLCRELTGKTQVATLDETIKLINEMHDDKTDEKRHRLISRIRSLVKVVRVWISKHTPPKELGRSRFKFVKRCVVEVELHSGARKCFLIQSALGQFQMTHNLDIDLAVLSASMSANDPTSHIRIGNSF